MSDFQKIAGFEEVWRPPVRPHRRTPEELLRLGGGHYPAEVRARLTRLCNRAPEVVVKITGRTHNPRQLHKHLDYISRRGQLELEDRDGAILAGQLEIKDLAKDWSMTALSDRRRRLDSPITLGIVLSMPAGSDPTKVHEAARAFAVQLFAGDHDYVFVLHTDTSNPHVHLTVCSRGDTGARLNPLNADLEQWRQLFARALRDRSVEAEATPRRARGVTRKPEPTRLRRIRIRYEAGLGEISQVQRSTHHEAAIAVFKSDIALRPWERQTLERQAVVRKLYLEQARMLAASCDVGDRELAAKVVAFVVAMPHPDSQRLALAREMRRALEVDRREQGGRRENARDDRQR